jgi:hypothetical protein
MNKNKSINHRFSQELENSYKEAFMVFDKGKILRKFKFENLLKFNLFNRS